MLYQLIDTSGCLFPRACPLFHQRDYIHVMDLAEGHILMLSALEKDEIYANLEKSAFGGSGGKYKAYNVSLWGRGFPVGCMSWTAVEGSVGSAVRRANLR